MDANDLDHWARVLVEARATRHTIPSITGQSALTTEEAYAIQRRVTAARLGATERIAGWKLGYTSQAMREQMGVQEPNFGPLSQSMLLQAPTSGYAPLLQPRVEPEIGIRFSKTIDGPLDASVLKHAIASVHACVEIVDSVFTNFSFKIEDSTADMSAAAFVVVGPELSLETDLRDIEVVLTKNGEALASARGSAASGDPVLGVEWLSKALHLIEGRVEANQLIITGGLTRAFPLEPGDNFVATFDGTHAVGLTRHQDGEHLLTTSS